MHSFIFSVLGVASQVFVFRRAFALKPNHFLHFVGCIFILSFLLMKTDIPILQEYGKVSQFIFTLESLATGVQAAPYLYQMFTSPHSYLHQMPMYCFVSERLIFSEKKRELRKQYWERFEENETR
ncbi:hypothetical protein ACFGZW_05125 [Pasteurella multocida]